MQPQINFEIKSVPEPVINFDRIKLWLIATAESHGKSVGRLNYLFTNDEEVLKINREFLNHDYYTDIITFDYSHRDIVSGDIVISLDTVKDNSLDLCVTYDSELLRVIVHGLLHLCGIDDKGLGEREIMEQNENIALSLWEKL